MTFKKTLVFLGYQAHQTKDGGVWCSVSFFDMDDQGTIEFNSGEKLVPELETVKAAMSGFGALCDVSINLRRDPQKGWKPSLVGLSPVE